MRLSAIATFTVFSIQLFSLDEAGGQLAGGKLAAEECTASSATGKKSPAPSHEVGRGRGMERQPSAGLQKAEGGALVRSQSQVVSQPRLGASKLMVGSRKQTPHLPPPQRKSQSLGEHLKGHGKFNTDTYSCFGIQSKTCKKPSDCDGCLGLYTCKLPRGKCDLKAISRKTGSFSRSIETKTDEDTTTPVSLRSSKTHSTKSRDS